MCCDFVFVVFESFFEPTLNNCNYFVFHFVLILYVLLTIEIIPRNVRDAIIGCWMLNPDSNSFEFSGTPSLASFTFYFVVL